MTGSYGRAPITRGLRTVRFECSQTSKANALIERDRNRSSVIMRSLADLTSSQKVLRNGSVNHKRVLIRDRRPKSAAHPIRERRFREKR